MGKVDGFWGVFSSETLSLAHIILKKIKTIHSNEIRVVEGRPQLCFCKCPQIPKTSKLVLSEESYSCDELLFVTSTKVSVKKKSDDNILLWTCWLNLVDYSDC